MSRDKASEATRDEISAGRCNIVTARAHKWMYVNAKHTHLRRKDTHTQ